MWPAIGLAVGLVIGFVLGWLWRDGAERRLVEPGEQIGIGVPKDWASRIKDPDQRA